MPSEKRDVEICQERLKYLVKNVQKLTNLADLLDFVKPKPINPDLNYGIQDLVEKASHDFIQSRIAKRSSQKKGISKFSEKLNSRQDEFLKFFHSYRPLNCKIFFPIFININFHFSSKKHTMEKEKLPTDRNSDPSHWKISIVQIRH